jgi:hypothetical protein
MWSSIRAILAGVCILFPVFAAADSVSIDKAVPIAQVNEVRGTVTVTSSADGSSRGVQKGNLLGPEDSLVLDKNASIALYFKSGGRRQLSASDSPVVHKVAGLVPHVQAYRQSVPAFGATRGIDNSQAPFYPGGFFYPQEAIILDNPPVIEFILFRGAREAVVLGGATVRVVKNSVVVDSRKFNSLEYGLPCVYVPANLTGQEEYSVELKIDFPQAAGNVVAVSFPLYITGVSDPESTAKYASLSDPVYRSFESSFLEYKGSKRPIALIKQLANRPGTRSPVVVIELFLP